MKKEKKSPKEVKSQEQAQFTVLFPMALEFFFFFLALEFFMVNIFQRLQFNAHVTASSESLTFV